MFIIKQAAFGKILADKKVTIASHETRANALISKFGQGLLYLILLQIFTSVITQPIFEEVSKNKK